MEFTFVCISSQICRPRMVYTMSGACGGHYHDRLAHNGVCVLQLVVTSRSRLTGGENAVRDTWRTKAFSGRLRFGDYNSEGQERLWSGAADDSSSSRRVLARSSNGCKWVVLPLDRQCFLPARELRDYSDLPCVRQA